MKYFFAILATSFVVSLAMTTTTPPAENCVPTQIHLSLTSANATNAQTLRYSSIRVSWVTTSECNDSTTLEYESYETLLKGSNSATGMVLSNTSTPVTTQISLGTTTRTSYMHYAETEALTPRAQYAYRIKYGLEGGYYSATPIELFTAPHVADSEDPVHLVFYADMGNSFQGTLTVQSLLERNNEDQIDLIMHVGDFAYDLDTNESQSSDLFFEQIQPIVSKIPMHGVPGNHEVGESMVQYKQRVFPPNMDDVERIYYAFKLKNIYFINIVTQFLIPHQKDLLETQQQWVEEELTKANADDTIDWIIVNGHRPLYCSRDTLNCGDSAAYIRSVMEESLKNHKVDFYIGGHLHNYERMYPVYKGQVMGASVTQGCYINPGATTYIVSGSAGNEEFMLPTPYARKSFLAAVKVGASYSEMTVYNSTHVYFEERSSSSNAIQDSFWLIKGQPENNVSLDSFLALE